MAEDESNSIFFSGSTSIQKPKIQPETWAGQKLVPWTWVGSDISSLNGSWVIYKKVLLPDDKRRPEFT